MSDDATTLEILRWAVDPSRAAPEVGSVDTDALVELATFYRVLPRLISRLDAARPAWFPLPRLTRLRFRQHGARQAAHGQIAAAVEISDALRARGLAPPIFVKGFAAYALTGDADHLHLSGDLDLFAEDLPALWDALHEIGYTGKRKETHEWAKLNRGRVTLDVHQYFPVIGYPGEVRTLPADALDARRHPGQWHLSSHELDFVEGAQRLDWDGLSVGAAPGIAPGTERLRFPPPDLLCLIHCAHCFRSSARRLHYLNPVSGFRLYELLAVRDLAALPGFDAARFSLAVERHGGHDAVGLVNAFARSFLGTPVLLRPMDDDSPPPVFPEHLVYGGWISQPDIEDWFLMRGIEHLLARLDADTRPAHCTLDTESGLRLLTCGTDCLQPRLDIAWDAPASSLRLDWEFTGEDVRDNRYEVLTHFGSDSFVQVRLDAGWQVGTVVQKSDHYRSDQKATAETIADGDRHIARLSCPVPSLPTHPPNVKTLPLFLAWRRLSPGGETTEAAAYLPLRLVQP